MDVYQTIVKVPEEIGVVHGGGLRHVQQKIGRVFRDGRQRCTQRDERNFRDARFANDVRRHVRKSNA